MSQSSPKDSELSFSLADNGCSPIQLLNVNASEGRYKEYHALTQQEERLKERARATNNQSPVNLDQPPRPVAPMDNGVICWLQVIGSFCMWTNSWGWVNAFGAFQTYYQTELLHKTSPSDISWVGSLQAFLLLSVGVLAGPVFDAGYFRHLCIGGNLLVVLGLLLLSFCKEYWQVVLAQGLVCGCGFGCLFVPGTAIIPQYFNKKRAFAGGLSAAGSGFGGMIVPIMFRNLQPLIGFGWTVRVLCFFALLNGCIAVFTLRNRLPAGKMRQLVDWSGYFDNRPLVFLAFAIFFTIMAVYIPVFYIGSYALKHGIGANLAFYLLAILQGSSVVGRIVPVYFADKIGPVNLIIPATLGNSVLAWAWMGVKDEAGLITFAVLYGAFNGLFLSLAPSSFAPLTPDLRRLGTMMGTGYLISSFGVLIGPPIAGAILRHGESFRGLQAFTASVLLLAVLSSVACRVSKVGWKMAKL